MCSPLSPFRPSLHVRPISQMTPARLGSSCRVQKRRFLLTDRPSANCFSKRVKFRGLICAHANGGWNDPLLRKKRLRPVGRGVDEIGGWTTAAPSGAALLVWIEGRGSRLDRGNPGGVPRHRLSIFLNIKISLFSGSDRALLFGETALGELFSAYTQLVGIWLSESCV